MFKFIVMIGVFVATASAQSENTNSGDVHSHHHHSVPESSEVVFTGMRSGIFLGVPMAMDGSGTGWIPAAGETPMRMFHSGDWMFMTHGSLFIRYISQQGNRSVREFSFPNWYMVSAQRMVGKDQQLTVRAMLSADRIFDGGSGYPLLLQSGETWNGNPLIDRQHPHDGIAELAVAYSNQFTPESGVFVYVGYPGEPALGPTAFMHRPAARPNPDAPIGHHWQDATHITYGVATAGAVVSPWKFEASIFTGREPDEDRFNFERPRFDSYSGRITVNPMNELSLQASYGFLKDPEGHGDDVQRLSASALYSTDLFEDRSFHSSVIWGQNEEHHQLLNSFLMETALKSSGWEVYGRAEIVQKPRGKLGIITGKDVVETVRQYTAGVQIQVYTIEFAVVNLGLQGMLSQTGDFLQSVYGKYPGSVQVYVQFQ